LVHVPESQSHGAVHALPFAGPAQQPAAQWLPSPQSVPHVQGLPTSFGKHALPVQCPTTHVPPAPHAKPVKGPPHALVGADGAPAALLPLDPALQFASLLGSRAQIEAHRAIAAALGHA
jgi:hypothetical protein